MDAIQAFSLKLSIITDVIQYTGPWSLLLALAENLRLTSPGAFRRTWQGIFIGPESDHCLSLSLTYSLNDSLTPV